IAERMFAQGDVRVIARRPVSMGSEGARGLGSLATPSQIGFKLSGSAKGPDGARRRPLLHVNASGKGLQGSGTCAFFEKNKLAKGPCEHLLGLRAAHMARPRDEDTKGGN